jgi:predicted alpha/beta-hydrolase family hydrolase
VSGSCVGPRSPTFATDFSVEAHERSPEAGGGRIPDMAIHEVETPVGAARVYVRGTGQAGGALVLGHGAGGGTQAVDLVAVSDVALEAGLHVALVEQPYRVAGRRTPPRPSQLDAAWIAVVEHLRATELADLPFIVGGRSLGARIACRTAEVTGAVAVLCLAFPLEPPRRSGKPLQSRLAELDAVTVPTLVVQGRGDPFGVPPAGPSRRVVTVAGDHGLKTDLASVADAVRAWLPGVVASVGRQAGIARGLL